MVGLEYAHGYGVKRAKTEPVQLLLQRAQTTGNLVPPGCFKEQWKWGQIWAKVWAFLPGRMQHGRKVLDLGQFISLHRSAHTTLPTGAKGVWRKTGRCS